MKYFARIGLLISALVVAIFVAAIQLDLGPKKPPAKAVVYVFWSTDCPVAKRYLPRLKSLLEKFYKDDRVEFELLFPNSNETIAGIQKYIRGEKISIPSFQDINASVARTYSVNTVPCFVVCSASAKAIYTGPLDDNQDPSLATRSFVENAIESACNGKPLANRYFPPLGCEITRDTKLENVPTISYVPQIREIIAKNCVRCHSYGGGAPFALTEYAQAYHWRRMIKNVVESGTMPPFSAYTDSHNLHERYALSDGDREKLIRWVSDGAILDKTGSNIVASDDLSPIARRPDKSGILNAKLLSHDSAHQYFGATWDLRQEQTVWVNRIQFDSMVFENVREISIYRIPKSAVQGQVADPSSIAGAEWIGTCSMGTMSLEFPSGIGKRMEPGDQFAFLIHRFSTQDRSTLPIHVSTFFESEIKGEVKSIQIIPKAFAIDPEDSHEIEVIHQEPTVVRWLGWRATTRLLGGTAWISVDQHLMGAWGLQAQFWQPEFHPVQVIEGNSITFRAVLSNWGMAQIRPFSPPQKIESGSGPGQESVVFQATYVMPLTSPAGSEK